MVEVASYRRVVTLVKFEDLQPDLVGNTAITAGRGLSLENSIL